MLKTLGALLISVSVSAVGFLFTERLYSRKKTLKEIIKLCTFSWNEIKQGNASVSSILEKYSVGNLLFLKKVKAGMSKEDISTVACEYIKNKTDADTFTDFLYGMGKTDIAGQKRHFEYYTEIFGGLYKEAEKETADKSKVYSALFVSLGAFIFILLN